MGPRKTACNPLIKPLPLAKKQMLQNISLI